MTIATTDVSTADRKWVCEEIVPVKIQKKKHLTFIHYGDIIICMKSPQ